MVLCLQLQFANGPLQPKNCPWLFISKASWSIVLYLKILKSSKSLTSSSWNSSPRSWSSIWLGTNYQQAGTCLNIWVASYSLISISIYISCFISNSLAGPIGLQSSPPLKFPSNSIKASTLVTIKPWSEPPERAG